MHEQKPWLKFYDDIPHSLSYPDKTMYEMVRDAARRFPEAIAWDFMGRRSTYTRLLADIDRAADALAARGLKAGETVTVCLPNCPQAVIAFYALNKLGVKAAMIHPLSAPTEIDFYLTETASVWAITLDAFYHNFAPVLGRSKVKTVLLARIGDFLPPVTRLGFFLTSGRKIRKPPADPRILWWQDFLAAPRPVPEAAADLRADDCAVILFSGGTSGAPKGIMLSSRNFNALGLQTATQGPMEPGDTILSILPMFHGFGLGVCIHTFLIGGGRCVLVPRFTSASVAKLIKRERPQYMAGVPTLYEALVRDKTLATADLSCLKRAYAGGDKLPRSVKERFETLVRERGGTSPLLEGYGLTESVTACIVTPKNHFREGSVGIPYPDMLAKIVLPGTREEAAAGADGELCVAGPTLMLGYLNSPEATAAALQKHADGRVWLHTGDICSMDADGFVYFKLRLKRIIKVSGVSVSPVQVEEALEMHPEVALSCVIGVPDPYKIQKVKAFVVLKDAALAGAGKAAELIEHCRGHLITWSIPAEIEFRESLPLTRVGKVAYSELEKEETL
jgi:long-chain acyl-CoA synthetase